jgi:Helicase HerA, central domain
MKHLEYRDLKTQYFFVSLGSFIAGLVLFVSSFLVNPKAARLFMLSGVLVNVGIAASAVKKKEWYEQEYSDLLDIESDRKKQQALLEGHNFQLVGSEEIETEEEPEEKDYRDFDPNRLADDSVHLAIFASSGSGKTLFLKHLFHKYFQDEAYLLIDIHGDRGLVIESKEHAIQLLEDFAHNRLHKLIIGHNRDFQSVAYMYMAMRDHLAYRFQNGGEKANWPQLNIIVEETPAVFKGLEEYEKNLLPSVNQDYLTEARKIGLRLIVVTQGDSIALLGLKGMSVLRSAYRFVRLGSEATKYARQKKLFELVSVLNKDIAKSLKDHKRSGSTALFKGSAIMIDEDEYMSPIPAMDYVDMELESEFYSENEFQDNSVDYPHSRGNLGESGLPETPQGLNESTNFNEYFGVPTNIPQTLNVPEAKVTVDVKDYWLAKWEESSLYEYQKSLKPTWLNESHIVRFFKYRNEGDTTARATKKMFTKDQYHAAVQWFQMVWNNVVGED